MNDTIAAPSTQLRLELIRRKDKHREWRLQDVKPEDVHPFREELDTFLQAADFKLTGLGSLTQDLAHGQPVDPLVLEDLGDGGLWLDASTHGLGGPNNLALLLALRQSGTKSHEALIFKQKVAKYSEDEARDDHGRWTGGGGGEGSEAAPKDPLTAGNVEDLINYAAADPAVQAADKANHERGDARNDPGVLDKDGHYSQEAHEENQRIAASMLNPDSRVPEGETPKAIVMVGKPGSGKSSVLDAMGIRQDFTIIDADEAMSRLGGYSPELAGAYHGRGGDIAENYLYTAAVDNNMNVVLDMTGKNTGKMENLAKELKGLGYDLTVIHTKISDLQAGQRAYARFKSGGRYVPLSFVTSAFTTGPAQSFEALKPYATEAKEYDTGKIVRKAIQRDAQTYRKDPFTKACRAGNVGARFKRVQHGSHHKGCSHQETRLLKQDDFEDDSGDEWQPDPDLREKARQILRDFVIGVIAGIAFTSEDDLYKIVIAGSAYGGGGLTSNQLAQIAQDAQDFNAGYAAAFEQDAMDAVNALVDGTYATEEEFSQTINDFLDSVGDRSEDYAAGGGKQAWADAVAAAAVANGKPGCFWNCKFGPGSCADCMSLHGTWMTWSDFDATFGSTICNGGCNCGPVPADGPDDLAIEDLDMGDEAA